MINIAQKTISIYYLQNLNNMAYADEPFLMSDSERITEWNLRQVRNGRNKAIINCKKDRIMVVSHYIELCIGKINIKQIQKSI